MQEAEVTLTETSLVDHLVGREVYRRTEYLLLRADDEAALVAVRKASDEPLFSPVVEARVLAGPDAVVWIESPETDVGNATALYDAARPHLAEGVRAFVVLGRHQHVNFLWDPAPLRVRVLEVVPPEPPKLWDQARQVVAYDEDLPPVDLDLDRVSIADIAAGRPTAEYLLPCRGSGADLPAHVAYLDTRPADRHDWTLIGCERSMQFHRHFYGDEPPQVDLCPLRRVEPGAEEHPTLAKCCLRERGVDVDDDVAVVPWGANLDEVRAALRGLVGLGPVAVPELSSPVTP